MKAKDETASDRLLAGFQALEDVAFTPEIWKGGDPLRPDLKALKVLDPTPKPLIAETAISADLELWHADERFEQIRRVSSLKTRSFGETEKLVSKG